MLVEFKSVRKARSSSRRGLTLAFIFASINSPKAEMRDACVSLMADLTVAEISVRNAADCSAVKPARGAWSEPDAIKTRKGEQTENRGGLEPPTESVASAAVMLKTAQDVPRQQILSQNGYG